MTIEKERLKFESLYPMPKHVVWTGHLYSVTDYGVWEANKYLYLWLGWLARAQSE